MELKVINGITILTKEERRKKKEEEERKRRKKKERRYPNPYSSKNFSTNLLKTAVIGSAYLPALEYSMGIQHE